MKRPFKFLILKISVLLIIYNYSRKHLYSRYYIFFYLSLNIVVTRGVKHLFRLFTLLNTTVIQKYQNTITGNHIVKDRSFICRFSSQLFFLSHKLIQRPISREKFCFAIKLPTLENKRHSIFWHPLIFRIIR